MGLVARLSSLEQNIRVMIKTHFSPDLVWELGELNISEELFPGICTHIVIPLSVSLSLCLCLSLSLSLDY